MVKKSKAMVRKRAKVDLTAKRAAGTKGGAVVAAQKPDQRVVRGNLGQLLLLAAAHRIAAPALLIVGEVARFGARAPAAVAARTLPAESVITAALS